MGTDLEPTLLFEMKLIIAGGRDYKLDRRDFDRLDDLQGVTEVVSGGARGVDSSGECWARNRLIPIKMFPADWDLHGKQAGFLRNTEMAEYADALAIFPGGKGSAHMLREAQRCKLRIFDFRSNTLF